MSDSLVNEMESLKELGNILQQDNETFDKDVIKLDEPVVEPVIEPVPEPVPEPVVEPVPEPVPEPVVEPLPESLFNPFIVRTERVTFPQKIIKPSPPQISAHLQSAKRKLINNMIFY
jgi:hypothetical protein